MKTFCTVRQRSTNVYGTLSKISREVLRDLINWELLQLVKGFRFCGGHATLHWRTAYSTPLIHWLLQCCPVWGPLHIHSMTTGTTSCHSMID